MTIREPEVKNQVNILRAACPGLAQQHAYEVLAKLKGYADWNTMSAALKKRLHSIEFLLKATVKLTSLVSSMQPQ